MSLGSWRALAIFFGAGFLILGAVLLFRGPAANPPATIGGMYYDTTLGKVRMVINGEWVDVKIDIDDGGAWLQIRGQ